MFLFSSLCRKQPLKMIFGISASSYYFSSSLSFFVLSIDLSRQTKNLEFETIRVRDEKILFVYRFSLCRLQRQLSNSINLLKTIKDF